MASLGCQVIDCVLLCVIFIVTVSHTDSKSRYKYNNTQANKIAKYN